MQILNESGEGSVVACDRCRRPFAVGESRIRAVELHNEPTFGGPGEPVEGLEADFHDACFPRPSSRWRRLVS